MPKNKLSKKLQARWRRFKKSVKVVWYNFRLRFFGWRNNTGVNIRNHWRKHIHKYSTVAYLVVSTTLSLIVPTLFTSLKSSDVLNFYTAIGGMTGSMLAIIFTFITLLANYALTEYPPEFFKLSGNDRKQAFIYVALALLSVFFFTVGLSYPGDLQDNYWLNVVTIFLLMFVFFLVFISYLTMRARLNPQTAFKNYIVSPALKLIDEAEKKANKIAKLFASNPSLKDVEVERHAKQQAQLLMGAHYNQLNNYIGIMYDYHAMLRENKKERAAINVLVGIQKILFRYIEARRDNLIVIPTAYLMVLETDSQDFFASDFERLIAKLSEYIDDDYADGIRNTVTLYTNLGIKLSELKVAVMRSESPQFEQCVGYLNQARDLAMQKKNVEATFEIAKAYGILGAVAISKDLRHSQSYAYDSLHTLYMYAIISKQDSVAKQVIWSFGKMSDALFNKEKIDLNYTDFTLFVDKYKTLVKTYLLAQNNSYDLSPNNTEDILRPVRHLHSRFKLLVRSGSVTRNPDRLHDQHDAIEIVDIIRDIARTLADTEKSQVVDRYFYYELMRILQSCIFTLIDLRSRRHWQRYQREIDSKLNWAVNQFGFGLQKVDDKVETSHLRELADKLTIAGLYAISKDNDETVKTVMTTVTAMADAYMRSSAKDSDWESPRIMMNVFTLTAAALHKGKIDLLRHGRTCTNSFKGTYLKTLHSEKFSLPRGAHYIGTYPDQLNYEMSRFIHPNDYHDPLIPASAPLLRDETSQEYAAKIFSITDEEYIATRAYLKPKSQQRN